MAFVNAEITSPVEDHRRIEHNELHFFLDLLISLCDQRIIPLQKKVNAYIQKYTDIKICFLMYKQYSVPEIYIDVVGTKELCPVLIIEENVAFYTIVTNCVTPRVMKTFEIESNLKYILDHALEKDHVCKFDNFIIIPIMHPKNGVISFHLGLINYNNEKSILKKTFGIIGEIFRYSIGLFVNTFFYEEERRHHELTKKAITASFNILEAAGNLDELNIVIRKELSIFFGAEQCYLLLLDEDKLVTRMTQNETTFDIGYEKLKDVSVPLGAGVQGNVALSMKLINNSCVEHVNQLHKAAGLKPRNLLCFPMYYRGELFGVIEIHNKIKGAVFTKMDEEYTLPFGIICGVALGKCIVLRKLDSSRNAQFKGDILLLRNILLKKIHLSKVLLCVDGHTVEYNYFKFIPFQIPEKHIICYCKKMLREIGVLERYNVSDLTLTWFLCIVRNGYSNLPFHNWYHAFAVFHYIYMLIHQFGLIETEVITSLEAFALLIAALCHDLEFRGSTTRFQPIRGATLASLYSSPGVVEKRFSASQTIRLFSLPDANILEEMSPNDFLHFVRLINTLITTTDIWEHLTKMSELEQLLANKEYDENNLDHRNIFYSIIMVAGDLCSYGKTWSYCKFMSQCQYKEFYRFRDLFYAVNIFNLSNVSPNPVKIPALQIQFMTDVCIPTFNYLQTLIPAAEVLYKRVENNLKKWQDHKVQFEPEEELSVEDLLKQQIADDLVPDQLKRIRNQQ